MILGTGYISCTLDEGVPDGAAQDLVLQATQNASVTTLSWDEVRSKDFREYVILQSSFPIPEMTAPTVDQNITVLARLDDRSVTSLKTSSLLFTEEACYKLFVKIDERFIASSNICVDPQVDLVFGFNDRAEFVPGRNEILYFDRQTKEFRIYDLVQNMISSTRPDAEFFFPILAISGQNESELFAWEQSNLRVKSYSYPSLAVTGNRTFNQSIWSLQPYGDFVFMANNNSSSSFQVLSRSGLQVIQSRQGLGNSNRNIAVFPGDPLVVMEAGDLGIRRYEINAAGAVIKEDAFSTPVVQPQLQNTCAQSSSLFIAGRSGTMVNRAGEVIGQLISTPNTIGQMFRIHADENLAAAIVTDNLTSTLQLFDISQLPLVTRLESYSLPQANFSELFFHDGVLFLTGVSFATGTATTFIARYPI